jgi:hypothetical protein
MSCQFHHADKTVRNTKNKMHPQKYRRANKMDRHVRPPMLFATKLLALVEAFLLVLVIVVGVGALSKAAAYPPFAISAVDDVVLLAAVAVDAASDVLEDWLTFS